ncbi:MAG TPA: hypothetical protein VFC09_07895 [Candidatus Dormibacteraeota bacterium]|nr:hypothetical protein [Candidatus Dormibacteraeota bacterium]
MNQHLLAGEDPETRDLGEIRHWIRVYTQAWKTARRAGLLNAAQRFRRRLEYWTTRHAELMGRGSVIVLDTGGGLRAS